MDRTRNVVAWSTAQISTGHWRSTVYFKRINERGDDRCWFSHGRKMTKSHALLHRTNATFRAARVEACDGKYPGRIRFLLNNPRRETCLLRFPGLSAIGILVGGECRRKPGRLGRTGGINNSSSSSNLVYSSFIPKRYVDIHERKEMKNPRPHTKKIHRRQRARCAELEGWGPLYKGKRRKRGARKKWRKLHDALLSDPLLRLPRNPPVQPGRRGFLHILVSHERMRRKRGSPSRASYSYSLSLSSRYSICLPSSLSRSPHLLRPGGTRYGRYFNQGQVAKWLEYCLGCKKSH